jgi:formylmethanofuran dehydrogenase subunit D
LTEEFKVTEAHKSDTKHNIVRIDWDSMDALGVKPKDYVKIAGKHAIIVEVRQLSVYGEHKGIIQMNNRVRLNLVIDINDTVTVERSTEVLSKLIEETPSKQDPFSPNFKQVKYPNDKEFHDVDKE